MDSPVEWLAIDTNGTKHGNAQTGSLSEAAAMAGGRKVIVFVPGTDVLLCEPVLPPKSSGAKLLQIIPFALEEQLAADVEDLHFAVGKRETRPGTPVAVVARELIDKWLAALATAGLQAEAMYAETSVLPITPNGITLLVDGTRVYVQRDGTPGAVLDVEPLIEALQLALASGEEAREHVTIYLTEDAYERERDLFEGLREFTASLQLKLLPDGVLQLLATNAFQSAPVNLLQGGYAVKTKLTLSFRPWRYAAMLAATFLVLHVGLKIWQSYDLQRTEARLDDEITQVFQQ
jgi:general secretion pathway protein L